MTPSPFGGCKPLHYGTGEIAVTTGSGEARHHRIVGTASEIAVLRFVFPAAGGEPRSGLFRSPSGKVQPPPGCRSGRSRRSGPFRSPSGKVVIGCSVSSGAYGIQPRSTFESPKAAHRPPKCRVERGVWSAGECGVWSSGPAHAPDDDRRAERQAFDLEVLDACGAMHVDDLAHGVGPPELGDALAQERHGMTPAW